MLPLIPVVAAVADYTENAITLFHIWRLPEHDVGVAFVGTLATFLKWMLACVSLSLVFLGWVRAQAIDKAKKV